MGLITDKLKPVFGFWNNDKNIVHKFFKFAKKISKNCENWYNIDKKNLGTLSGHKINIKYTQYCYKFIFTFIFIATTICQWIYTNYFITQEILFNFLYFSLAKYWWKFRKKDIQIFINSEKHSKIIN